MVFSKKFDYRKRTQERDLFFGLPSTPFLVFLSFIAILLIFNLIITNNSITGNVINNIDLKYNTYEPGEKLVGAFSLNFSQGDLIPKDSKIQVLISSPACALYYVCSDGSLSEWYTYDHNRKTPCVEKDSSPWETCPDESRFTSTCKNQGYACCNGGYGQGLYYQNLNCTNNQQCFDRCANISNGGIVEKTLEQFIQAYGGPTSNTYYGNFTTGDYNNVDGLTSLSGNGEGFGACQLSNEARPGGERGAAIDIKAIQNFPTGNAVAISEPIIPIEPEPTDLEMVSVDYDYGTQDLTVVIRNNGEAVDSNNWFDVNLYWNWQTNSGGAITCPPTATSDVSITGNAASGGGTTNPIFPVLNGVCLLETKTIQTGMGYGEEKIIIFENYNLSSKNITVSINSVGLEKDMSNNNLTEYIGLPADLIIKGIYYDYETSQLSATVKNIGGSTAENFYVQACKMVSGVTNPLSTRAISSSTYCSVLSAQEISILNPDAEARISFGTYDLGGSTIKIKADSTNSVSEFNETNNENTTYIPALAELPDIEIVGYSYECGTKTISINLKNNGKNPTGAFSLAFCTEYKEFNEIEVMGASITPITGKAAIISANSRCVGLLIPSISVDNLAGDETITVETTNSALDGASFTLDANPGRTIFESTYNNNRLGVSIPKLPDFEVLAPTYYSTSDQLYFEVRNNGLVQGTTNVTVCEVKTILKCGYELQGQTAFAISDFFLTGEAITQPGCWYVTVCADLPSYPITHTFEPGTNATFLVTGVEGKNLQIIADKSNLVCETDESNNQQNWDYGGGKCLSNETTYGLIPSQCSGTYTNGTLYSHCSSDTANMLIQYSCIKPDCVEQTVDCEFGCNSTIGACNQPPVGNCVDTDHIEGIGDINYLVQGTCTDQLGNSFTDYCANTGLVEYYCNQGTCSNQTYSVGGSGCYTCQEGACSNNTYGCNGWNNTYNLSLSAVPLNLATPKLDLGYFTLDISLITSDGTIISRAMGEFMNNDTSYRYCNSNYQCVKGYGINIEDDCSSDSDCDESTGGTGGPGGDDTTTCYEDWSCGTWSSCGAEGVRTRDCARCGVTNSESEVCVYGCVEDWACSDWTVCDESGIQTQICTDKNTCSARNSEYVEQRECCSENWDCQWGTCKDGKQAKVCTDKSSCGTGFLKPTDETRECSSGFGLDLSSVPLGVKIAIPIAIVGGVLASLFLIRRKPTGEIIKSGQKSTIQKVAQTATPAKANYPELSNYIKTAKGQGMNDNDIKKKLLDAGWPKDVIDSGMK